MGKTIAEKILSAKADKPEARAGDYVMARPDLIAFHELLFPPALKLFRELGVDKVWDPDKIVMVIDHTIPISIEPPSAPLHKMMRDFVAEQGISKFYDIGQHGIEHHLMAEKGHVVPGILYTPDDGHGITLGALGCLAIALSVELFSVLATGEAWFRIPETVLVTVEGEFRRGTTVRDLAQYMSYDFGSNGAEYRSIEFEGPAVASMGMDARLTLVNWTKNTGAKCGIIAADDTTLEYVRARTDQPFEVVTSDPDANYVERRRYDVSDLEPVVALPPRPDDLALVSEVKGTRIHQAAIGSCAGGRMDDLRQAAEILDGRQIKSGVRMLVTPMTMDIYNQAEQEGLLGVFTRAGAIVNAPGCGHCFGYTGQLVDGEVCIANHTINYRGRMGSRDAEIYLSSPYTVAASAVAGEITDPRSFLD